MVKTFEILIEYKEQLLREQKRLLNIIEEKIETLENDKTQLLLQIEKEKQMLQLHPEFSSQFLNYYDSVQEKIDSINKTIENMRKELAPIEQEITILFSDIKKFEMINEQKLLEEQEKLDKQQELMIDELTMIRFLKEQNS